MFYNQASQPNGIPEQAIAVAEGGHHPLVLMLDKMGLAEVANTPEGNRQFWEDMSFEQAERFFVWANGVVRGVTAPERGFADEQFTMMVGRPDETAMFGYHAGYLPPTTAHARELLREVWDASKGLGDKEAATLLGLGIVSTHRLPYANGRMARLAYMLRLNGYDGSDQTKKTLTSVLANGARYGLNFDPNRASLPLQFAEHQTEALCQNYGYTGKGPTQVEPVVSEWFKGLASLFGGEEAMLRLVEPHFSVPLVTELLLERGVSPEGLLKKDGKITAQAVLDQIGPASFHEIVKKSENLKLGFVRSIISCLAKGDESVHGVASDLVAKYEIGKSGTETMEAVFVAFAHLALDKMLRAPLDERFKIPLMNRDPENFKRFREDYRMQAEVYERARHWDDVKWLSDEVLQPPELNEQNEEK